MNCWIYNWSIIWIFCRICCWILWWSITTIETSSFFYLSPISIIWISCGICVWSIIWIICRICCWIFCWSIITINIIFFLYLCPYSSTKYNTAFIQYFTFTSSIWINCWIYTWSIIWILRRICCWILWWSITTIKPSSFFPFFLFPNHLSYHHNASSSSSKIQPNYQEHFRMFWFLMVEYRQVSSSPASSIQAILSNWTSTMLEAWVTKPSSKASTVNAAYIKSKPMLQELQNSAQTGNPLLAETETLLMNGQIIYHKILHVANIWNTLITNTW